MIIDFHTHTFPARIAQRAIAGMQAASHAAAFTDGTPEGLRASMKNNVDCSVVLAVATNPTKLSSMNDVSIAENGKDGLIYFGAMHPQAENWNEELTRLAAAGIKGIKIHPLYQDTDIDDIRYLRILGRAAELGLITVMHSGWDIGFPGVVRCSPAMTRNALRQLGSIPMVLAHMGGWKAWDQVCGELGDTGCYIDTALALDAITPVDDHYTPQELALLDAESFCGILRSFGAHRVLFGTDSPWASQEQELQKLRALPLTREEQEKLFSGNARKLLGL